MENSVIILKDDEELIGVCKCLVCPICNGTHILPIIRTNVKRIHGRSVVRYDAVYLYCPVLDQYDEDEGMEADNDKAFKIARRHLIP